jgi:hypothetical protein
MCASIEPIVTRHAHPHADRSRRSGFHINSLAAGACGYLLKPLRAAELVAAVKDVSPIGSFPMGAVFRLRFAPGQCKVDKLGIVLRNGVELSVTLAVWPADVFAVVQTVTCSR